MSAVIYDTVNTKIIKYYPTMGGAKAALTRAQNSGKMRYLTSFGYGLMKADRIATLDVCSAEHFHNEVDHMVTVKNLMSGTEVQIRASDEGGCTDPSTERYWSM